MRSISEITDRNAVLQAIAEYDQLGQADFLEKYGFRPARKYRLVHDGKGYDSKAILGVAYRYQFPSRGALASDDFSGGEATVGRVLDSLGFTVVKEGEEGAANPRRNPNWTRDEVILALELYFRVNPLTTSESNPEIVALSEMLNRLPIHSNRPDGVRFRNPNGVYMKMCNLLRLDPGYTGVGLKAGGKIEEDVWNDFFNDRARLRAVAEAIRASVEQPVDGRDTGDEPDIDEAAEGAILSRLHQVRERNSQLVKAKKKRAIAETGGLTCEVCNFDFKACYGALGEGFIECHHTIPLSRARPETTTKLADLALVCANCHRMLHRGRRWLSIPELRLKIGGGDGNNLAASRELR
jgi:5-methylcytosine-specific restriction protein A